MPDTPFEIPGSPNAPWIAGADFSVTGQFRFQKQGGTEGQIVPITGATDKPIALLRDKPLSGRICDAVMFGIYQVEAGAAIAAGAQIQPDSVGRAITAVSTGFICGTALQAAAGAGERIACFINTFSPSIKA